MHQAEEYRVEARYEEAVGLAERTFLDDFARLVGHLCERLSGTNPDGTVRIFRDAAVEGLGAFIERYHRLDLRTDPQLDELIGLARRSLGGVTPRRLRDHPGLRRTVASQLAWVAASLEAMRGDRAP